jgi:hypothetical protein
MIFGKKTMNKEINLVDILKSHEGETFWLTFGECIYVSTIFGKRLVFSMVDDHHHFQTDSTGKVSMFRGMSVSSMVLPDKIQHDWNKWKENFNKKDI